MYSQVIYMCTTKIFTCVQTRYLHVNRQDIYMCTDKLFTCVQTSYLHGYRQAMYMCTDKIFTCVQTRYLHVYKLVLFHTSMFEVIVIPVWSVFKYNVKVLFFPEPVLYIINFKCIKFALLIFIHKYLINYEKLILFCLHRN